MEKNYPRFRTSRELDVRFAPQLGIMQCGYNHIVRAFGQPSFSMENNDTFEGTEQCAWHIEFENGNTAVIAEERGFGDRDHNVKDTTAWKVNSRSPHMYEWIKQIIRDSNPNER